MCSSIGLHRISLVRASGEVQATCFRSLAGYEGRLSSGRTVLLASGPVRHRCQPLFNRCQPVVNRSLCSSIGLRRISLVGSSGESFRRCTSDALEGTGDACFLGELFCRRPVLLDPPPPCAPTRPARGMSGFWTRHVNRWRNRIYG